MDLPAGWHPILQNEVSEPYFAELMRFLDQESAAGARIYPPRQWIFRALDAVPYEKVRVVILGQDPYHGDGQAIGLSFGVPNTLKPKPPSLKNIFKELQSDLGIALDPMRTDLLGWARQGVLLLNTVLTVRADQAFSHRDKGWERFTDQVIRALDARPDPIVFVLWGAAAQKKKQLIQSPHHAVLESAHPSPLSASRGFFGCRHFSQINEIIKESGHPEIDWSQTSE